MARQAISVGFPSPNYVAETGSRDAILPGQYLIETAAGPPPAPPPQRKHRNHLIEEDEDHRASFEVLEDWAFFIRRPATPLVVSAPSHQRAWLRHHFPVDDDDVDWLFLHRRAAAFGVRPLSSAARPWLQHHFAVDADDEQWLFFLRRATVPLVVPGGLRRPWLRQHLILDADEAADWTPPAARHELTEPAPVVTSAAVGTLFIANLGRLMGRHS